MSDSIAADVFYSDGRGPELKRALWDARGTALVAIDYTDPNGVLRHVRFHGPQVAMFYTGRGRGLRRPGQRLRVAPSGGGD